MHTANDAEHADTTAATLELLDRSWQAYAAGDNKRGRYLLNLAQEADPVGVSVVTGGIAIGEIPNPDTHYSAWADYVVSARERADDIAREAGSNAHSAS